jgi:hypothetical protein
MSKVVVESWEDLLAEEMAASFEPAEEPIEDFGIVYEDWEELAFGDRELERDMHRWELDPASAEDYFDRHPGRLGPSLRWRHFGH